MIDYEKTREIIVKGLKSYGERPVIRQNQDKEPPEYDYLAYTITTLAGENKGTYGVYADGTQRKSFNQIWSISAVSDNDTQSVLLAAKAREWFDNVGTTYLNDNGIIVQSVGSITNRDNLLTVGYEYKKGFDVVFTIEDIVGNNTDQSGEIESYELGVEESKGGA